MNFLLPILAGLVCGIISGFGIGGGSLLMVWMTAVVSLPQHTAQGINLLYFLPTAAASLLLHIKNKFVSWKTVIPAVIAGCVAGGLTALLAAGMDAGILRKIFGGFLLLVGCSELFGKHTTSKDRRD